MNFKSLLQIKVIVSFLLWFYVSNAHGYHLALLLASSRCYETTPCQLHSVTKCKEELFNEIDSGNKNPTREMQCFAGCLMHHLDLFLDGRVSSEVLKMLGREAMESYQTDNIAKRLIGLEKIRTECDSEIDEYADECELAYQFAECVYRNLLPDLIPPIIN